MPNKPSTKPPDAPRLVPGLWFRRNPSRNEHFVARGAVLLFDGDLREVISYDPGAEADLLEEFSDIGALAASGDGVQYAICRFAEKYGPLGYFHFHEQPVAGEPIGWTEAHARGVHAALRLRALLDGGQDRETRKYLDTIWDGPRFGECGRTRPLKFWSAYRDANAVPQLALQVICHLVSPNIEGLRWALSESSGSPRLEMRYGALLEFIYWQVAQRVAREGRVKICRNCGNVFLTENVRAEFCLPLPGATFSRCRSAFNNRMHHKRAKKDLRK